MFDIFKFRSVWIVLCITTLTSCSVLNPIQYNDTLDNYKTRQDVYELKTRGNTVTQLSTTLVGEHKSYVNETNDAMDIVIDTPQTNAVGIKLRDGLNKYNMAVVELTSHISEISAQQLELLDDIHSRSEPTFSVKWYWWVLIGIIVIGLIGGAPALLYLFSILRRVLKLTAGLAEATVEQMHQDDRIDNTRIPKSLVDDKK